MRNCYVKVAADGDNPPIKAAFYAIAPGAGVGMIIEGNDIANLEAGVFDANAADCAQDLIIRDNYLHYVSRGLYFNRSSGTVGRIIATGNVIDLGVATGLPTPQGINLTGSGTGSRYGALVLRKNVIRDLNNPSGTTVGLYGINVSYASDLSVESNVINSAGLALNRAVAYVNCTAAKCFNNQISGGTLLRGYNGTKYVQELEDAVQDVLLPL